MADYKLLKEYYADGSEELMPSVIRKSDNAQIPYDTTNRDMWSIWNGKMLVILQMMQILDHHK